MNETHDFNLRKQALDNKNVVRYKLKLADGLTEQTIRRISLEKQEAEWMLNHRLQCFEIFKKMKLPSWGPNLTKLDLNKITYYLSPDAKKNSRSWDEVPADIKKTFEKLGIPEAEQKSLSGVGAQYESEVVYHNLQKELRAKGVVFEDCDVGLKEYPEIFKEHFMKCVPPTLHKFAALHGAVWSGGTFLYVPKGVKVALPLQAYFRMNAKKGGQFEHTLIIVDEGAEVQYIEGCSAPQYTQNSLHAGCVEIYIKKGARAKYSSVENWSKNTYNLNTKRAIVEEDGVIEWIGGNLGSGVTMLYPTSILKGRNARAEHLGIAYAGKGQNQDVGSKVYHLAPNTSSIIKSKSISKDGGMTTYRGVLQISKAATNSKSAVQCDALMMDNISKSDTIPYIDVKNKEVDLGHEATVGKISQEQIFYLMSRGLTEEQAIKMIVSGFIEPIVKQLPLEYAIEMNRLIELEMEGSLG
ncbi:MAG: Fe-S cluster assembly protein SufB [Nanoarchaeota archaeon]|nr:Fe-S cluster assembly protein SufB [Nanoarchaeota archaeon]MBU1269290.1 Fe-S cluster assembly protein SufB [Nanoarchaeota archaeon]MBU1603773.1 Fe-S cluster assembly protein SufB [Nanoarchaeota archaeon]MBU2443898.1 Fe-S cluster assembly protein SufB [Nanoarchaeota archaeon]